MATTVTKGQHPVSWTAFAFAISRSPFYYTEALHLEHRSVFWRVLYTWLHLGKWSRPKWHHDNTMTCQHSRARLPRFPGFSPSPRGTLSFGVSPRVGYGEAESKKPLV